MTSTAIPPGNAAPTDAKILSSSAESATPGRTTARRRSKAKWLAASALLLLLIAGLQWSHSRRPSASRLPTAPTAATSSVLIPAESESVAAAPLLAGVDTLASAPAPASHTAASAAVAVTQAASNAVSSVTETFATLRATLTEHDARIHTLESSDSEQNTQIASLRQDFDGFKAAQAAVQSSANKTPTASAAPVPVPASGIAATDGAPDATAAPAPTARRSRRAATDRAQQQARSSASRTRSNADIAAQTDADARAAGAVLAVDLWGGKPSVALARQGDSGTELRFFNEGESQGRVTVKRADIENQRATFATPKGDLTMAPREH